MSLTTAATLITGAAGFAGQHLLDRLARHGGVHGWWRPGGPLPPDVPGVVWHAIELTDRHAVAASVKTVKPRRIFHLAGAPSVETSWVNAVPHLQINAMGTAHLLDAIREVDWPCRTLVVTSAQVYSSSDSPIDEDGPLIPQSPYGLTKLAQDQLAAQAATADGLEVLIARPFNHVGPRQAAGFAVSSFARQIARIEQRLAPPTMRVGNLDTRRDVTDVRDVVDAYIRIMDDGRTGRAYNVCSGRAWRIRDLLDALLRLSTATIAIETDPARLRPNDVGIVQGDATRIGRELGWQPRIQMEGTLRDTLDWWRAEVHAGRDVTAS